MSDLLVVLRGLGTSSDRGWTIDSLNEHTRGVSFDVVAGDPEAEHDDGDSAGWDSLRRAPNADVVLLQAGLAVGERWHERLRSAAYADTVVATASAVPLGLLGAGIAATYNGAGDKLGTSVASLGQPLWGCVYVRREALNVALAAAPPREDQDVVPARCIEDVLSLPGLVHVLAPTVVVDPHRRTRKDGHVATPAVRRLLSQLEAELEPLRVTVDLRCCAYPWSGTQVHALNLVASLAKTRDVRVSALLPRYVDPTVRPHVRALPASVIVVRDGEALDPPPHVFHRPYQLFAEDDVTRVLAPASRLVVTHQDMILDRTPAYFPSKALWRGHTAATALTFIMADEIAFFSDHARQEAVREGLVDPAKTSVVPPGTDHFDQSSASGTRPGGLGEDVGPFILVLGHSYFHKNRVFALRVAEELRRRHAWTGRIVFAGGSPPDGSSVPDEAAFLRRHPELAARFVELGRVTDDEQRWLYGHAEVVVYPTLYEGFGLIPFEAAAVGTACVYSSRSSVAEYLPAEGAQLDVADIAKTADRLAELLRRDGARDEIVRAIRRAASGLTWDRAAAAYATVYRRAMDRPVGLSLAARGDVAVTTRSQVPADETEWRLLLLSRRVAPFKLVARLLFATVVRLARTLRRG